MSTTPAQLRQKRGRMLSVLTRVRRRAFVAIDSRGSRTQLIEMLKELDTALQSVEEVNEEYISTLVEGKDISDAPEYMEAATKQHEEAYNRIQQYLRSRQDEPASEAQVSRHSSKSYRSDKSSAPRKAEIALQVRTLEASQLERRLEQEQEEEKLRRQRKLQEAKDAVVAAKLEANLAKAAEDDLSWDRRQDFAGEEHAATHHGGPEVDRTEDDPNGIVNPPAVATSNVPAPPLTQITETSPVTATHCNHFLRSLPRLSLPKFHGSPAEWPRWFALFRVLVHDQSSLSPTEKMTHLQSSVEGSAQQAIAGMFYDGGLYPTALKALEDKFGRQEDIVRANMSAIFTCPSPAHLDAEALERFHSAVHSAVSVLQSLEYRGDIESTENLRNVVMRLPSEMKKEWAQHVLDLEPTRPTLIHLNEWLRKQVRVAMNYAAVSPQDKASGGGKRPVAKEGARGVVIHRTTLTTDAGMEHYGGCLCCEEQHRIEACPVFLRKTVDERAEYVATSDICFFCLQKGHKVARCRYAKKCEINQCKFRHHHLLHGSKRINISRAPAEISQEPQSGDASAQRVVAAASRECGASTTLLQVVPVCILGADGQSETVNALLDPGAQTSLCCSDILDALDIPGQELGLQLRNVEGRGEMRTSKRVELTLTSNDPSSQRTIFVPEAFAVPEINVTVPHLETMCSEWEHLKDLHIAGYNGESIKLLLGANVLEAVLQEEIRVGRPGQPVAVRTAFGWALSGSVGGLVPEHVRQVMFVSKITSQGSLEETVKSWWTTEAFGTKYESQEALSAEDRRALKILDERTKKVGGRYEVGLLWASDDVRMPNNYTTALRRLESTERNLKKHPEKAEMYEDVLMGYVTKGHARKLTEEEAAATDPKLWFLPHHAVVNPHKPKLRIVFDAAAPYRGVSLNDMLLTGPDLLQNLVGILLRFREERVALMADIQQMFHQVRVCVEDQPALTFLWRNCDPTREPDKYRMLVTIFGARCSPAAASYVLQQTAKDHYDGTPESGAAADAVRDSFYMDDFLRSEPNVDDASCMKREVTKLVAQGGFVLTKWTTSHPEVLSDSKDRCSTNSDVDLSCLGQNERRALGCVWTPSGDTFGVRNHAVEVPATKRGVLRRVAMVFDPLGIVAPFLLRAKVFIQRLWALKYGWDEELGSPELDTWNCWLAELSQLEKVNLPRCYKAHMDEEPDRFELHIFCDASEMAFGAVAFVRMSREERDKEHPEVSCAFLLAKTRLAPLRQISIVRLELQAAVLGTRLGKTVKDSMKYDFSHTYYWTDSQIVLGFIRHESRRFHTFTANRIAEIHDSSAPEQWYHVPGSLNPADTCSRGASGADLRDLSSWWSGPDFLNGTCEGWPIQPEQISELETENPEVRKSPCVLVIQVTGEQVLPDPARFSSWTKYVRTVAWVKRFGSNIKAAVKKEAKLLTALNGPEIEEARTFIVSEAQKSAYPDEVKQLAGGVAVSGLSSLRQLSPYIDERGVLRVGGRLEKAAVSDCTRHPIILPSTGDIARLIISDLHKKVLHAGLSHTLSEVRREFWVPKARAAVKRVINLCSFCRNRRARPTQPKMSDLPECRFDATRPFNSVGLDYFGPLRVKKFRKTEKRWVLLLTCMSTRAIHLEVVSSMDTDSFLMGLRRFFARRGKSSLVVCDNGSNFVAGEKELRCLVDEWNQAQILDELSQDHIDWRFNPPTASHMGGIWERLVASVKRALKVVLGNQCVSDEVLATVLAEVEYTLNTRPITYASGDARDPEPLTPNHFLLGQPEASLPPGLFEDRQLLSKKRWRHSQVLANHVWKRWRAEYLPSLNRREKWTKDARNIEEGDIVLMADDEVPRGYWPLATVSKVFPSDDGRVRTVEVRTAAGNVFKRPANKICVIEQITQR